MRENRKIMKKNSYFWQYNRDIFRDIDEYLNVWRIYGVNERIFWGVNVF